MLTKRRIIAAAFETTEGTPVDPSSSAGGIMAIDPKIDVDIKMHERNVAMATLSNLADIPGAQSARITFKAEMKGTGAAYTTAPAIGKFLVACGFKEVLTAPTAVYTPASTLNVGAPETMRTLTIWCYEDGVVKRISGARGNVKFTGKVGEKVFAEFDFLGTWQGLGALALPTATYEATIPPVLLSAGITIASYNAVLSGFEIDISNKLKQREDINNATGYSSTIITSRRPNGKFDPEMISNLGTHDWYGRWLAGTTGTLNIGPVGSVQYNKFTIAAPKALYTKVSDASREEIAIADTSFMLAMTSGDDELTITFS